MQFAMLFFFSSRRRHTSWPRDWSSDVCSSDLSALLSDLEDTFMPTALTPSREQSAPSPEERQSVRLTLRRPGWLKTEILAGLVVALALIPEAIAFSIIAGVDPRVGLFASFTMAVTTAILGGRPAMISAATGAVALVIAPLMASHGLDHLIAAVILAGVFQVVLSLVGAARLMRFIPRQVMVGFVNALAILIFISQVPELLGEIGRAHV